jgi:hypothetical protein
VSFSRRAGAHCIRLETRPTAHHAAYSLAYFVVYDTA